MTPPLVFVAVALGLTASAGLFVDVRAARYSQTRSYAISALLLKAVLFAGLTFGWMRFRSLPAVLRASMGEYVVFGVMLLMSVVMFMLAAGCECLALSRLAKSAQKVQTRSMGHVTIDDDLG